MMENLRTFIAIKLPDVVTAAISEVQEGIRSHGIKLRWVKPENIHLPLKFLGDIEKDNIEKIKEIIYDSVNAGDPISLFAKGVGFFPGIKRPRVVWVGVAGEIESLIGLQKRLEEGLEHLGFEKAPRPFQGHLTVGRVKGRIDPKKLGDVIKKYDGFVSETFYAESVDFYKSELRPTGAVYTVLASVPLGPNMS